MNGLITAFTTGITAFSATNIDDIVILLLLFSQVNSTFRRRHIVVGQYLGFATLVIASLPGFFGGLVVPRHLIGLLGLVPIGIGLSRLLNREEDSSEEFTAQETQPEYSNFDLISPQTYSVAALTVANGSDNIGVYVPLFASRDLGSLLVIIGVFFPLIAVWCYAAYKLTHQRAIAHVLTRYGNYLVPIVLIGLGAFIVLESRALSLFKLVASCVCLIILVRNSGDSPELDRD